MADFAAVMTGRGTGAISTIQLFGKSAQSILESAFRPAGTRPARFETGRILLGRIVNGDRDIDQVTIGCEAPQTFAIHCHGNPLIVEAIMRLLQSRGALPISAEDMLGKLLLSQGLANTITLETKMTLPKAKTVAGAKILANQINSGLANQAQTWLDQANGIPLAQLAAEARQVLDESEIAGFIIFGCTAVLVGPPNAGKSTLLNLLTGRQKSIVTATAGTTRDWVSAEIQIEPLSVTLIDTAGLARPGIAGEDSIEAASQRRTLEIIDQADLVLLILDGTQPAAQIDAAWIESLAETRTLPVINKTDLPLELDLAQIPESFRDAPRISAKLGTGIDSLLDGIRRTCGVSDFPLDRPIAFTDRQRTLLERLAALNSRNQAIVVITELLQGSVERSPLAGGN